MWILIWNDVEKNLMARRIRMTRKINLRQSNYICTIILFYGKLFCILLRSLCLLLNRTYVTMLIRSKCDYYASILIIELIVV